MLLVDTVNMGEDVEQAERLRDPSHVRNYTDAEWSDILRETGLGVESMRILPHAMDYAAWLVRTGCEGEEADRVTELLGERVAGGRLTLDKIAVHAVKGS